MNTRDRDRESETDRETETDRDPYLLWMPIHSMFCRWTTSGWFLMKRLSWGSRNSQPRFTLGTAMCSRNSFTSSGGSWS